MNFIFGTAGFAKELDWLTEAIISSTGVDYRADYFVAEDGNGLIGTLINDRKVISETDFFANHGISAHNCFIAVGSPIIKAKIVSGILSHASDCKFPNLIHPDVSYDKRATKMITGHGNVICSKSALTTDIVIGNFVHINLACTIGHDSVIDDFTTLSPGVRVSGNVHINEKVFIGTGAVIVEKISICDNTIIGAGSVVTKNLVLPGTYVGMPARKIR